MSFANLENWFLFDWSSALELSILVLHGETSSKKGDETNKIKHSFFTVVKESDSE